MQTNGQAILLYTNAVPAIGEIFSAMGLFRRDTEAWADEDKWGCHLYVTTNSTIKAGDWYIVDEKLKQADQYLGYRLDGTKTMVVATTDESLGLPLVSDAFIDAYVAQAGKLNEVAVQSLADGRVVLWWHTELRSKASSLQDEAIEYADAKTDKTGYWKPTWQAYYDAYLSVNEWQKKTA